VRLVLRSAVETGTPFAFNRDSVNHMNPNGHTGMIYCSNLCTEIAQNMAPIEHISTEVHTENGDTIVVTATRPGEFVVCNLASLSLGNLPVEDEAYMERTVETAIRALDNVIDLNFYPLEYARLTNQKYRSIGLGVSGYHHMLAKRGIRWESEEHLAFTDAVFEHINYAAVKADAALAREKGRYALFEGSDWQTGAYFEKRGYTSEKWQALAKTVAVQGMRNAYLLAVAPTSSTSILSGTSAGIDPIMKKFFLEEKKGSMLPRVAPELSMDTWWYYKAAHLIDQSWSVRAAGLRQRHIDQAQSMNLYITNDYSMRQVLRLYLEAWRAGVKTIYYVEVGGIAADHAPQAHIRVALRVKEGLFLQFRHATRPFTMSAARPLRSRPAKAARHKEDSMTELKKKPLFNPEGDPDVRLRRIDRRQYHQPQRLQQYEVRLGQRLVPAGHEQLLDP